MSYNTFLRVTVCILVMSILVANLSSAMGIDLPYNLAALVTAFCSLAMLVSVLLRPLLAKVGHGGWRERASIFNDSLTNPIVFGVLLGLSIATLIDFALGERSEGFFDFIEAFYPVVLIATVPVLFFGWRDRRRGRVE